MLAQAKYVKVYSRLFIKEHRAKTNNIDRPTQHSLLLTKWTNLSSESSISPIIIFALWFLKKALNLSMFMPLVL